MKEKEENTDLRFLPSYHFQVTFFGDDQKKAEEISKEQAEKEKAMSMVEPAVYKKNQIILLKIINLLMLIMI